MRLYDGGVRRVLPDGSVEIAGTRRVATSRLVGGLILFFAATMALAELVSADLFPLLVLLAGFAWVRLARSATRRILFDAGTRTLRIEDRGRAAGERAIPFADIRALRVEQREPRRIANAPPVLAVDGEDLLSVMDAHDNSRLEAELQALVGLPLQPTQRDTTGWSGL